MAILAAMSSSWRNARRTVRSLATLGWLAAGAWLVTGGVASAGAQPAQEYQIKAVFLFNFAQFVEWPAAAFAEPDSPLVIGVVGEDPFGANLDAAVRGEKIQGRSLVVRRFARAADIAPCHILFVSASENARMQSTLASLAGRRVLTVGDSPSFIEHGGMIRLLTDKNRVRLQINPDAAKAAGLVISSKLLRPAEIVTPPKD